MSPFPVRVDTNASFVPSGEKSGRDSVAGCETSKCASPPLAGTLQMSPPETNTISLRSGERDGSPKEGSASVPKAGTAINEAAQNSASKEFEVSKFFQCT